MWPKCGINGGVGHPAKCKLQRRCLGILCAQDEGSPFDDSVAAQRLLALQPCWLKLCKSIPPSRLQSVFGKVSSGLSPASTAVPHVLINFSFHWRGCFLWMTPTPFLSMRMRMTNCELVSFTIFFPRWLWEPSGSVLCAHSVQVVPLHKRTTNRKFLLSIRVSKIRNFGVQRDQENWP